MAVIVVTMITEFARSDPIDQGVQVVLANSAAFERWWRTEWKGVRATPTENIFEICDENGKGLDAFLVLDEREVFE